ncbi:MAG: site-specific DNA-methyltransferase [Defluviitaleaceae bacterium]|nr:site-specific DNA-methyltransferase [Defluviitaleaceae bacterium]
MIQLINGDSIEQLKLLKDGSVDCIVTSPPYWKGFEYEAYFNSYKQYLEWCEAWLRECKRVLKHNGTFYLNVINDSEITIRAFEIMEIATRRLMYKLHDTIIWYRYNQQPANTKRQLTNQCEYVFMLRQTSANIELDKEAAYNNAPDMFKTKNVGNVWELPFNKGKEKNTAFGRKETESKWGHSGFPLLLPETCILLSTKEGDTVLDLFMGTGTVGVACKKHNRKFIGIDIDKNAYAIAKKNL